jgi:hypothetical protein
VVSQGFDSPATFDSTIDRCDAIRRQMHAVARQLADVMLMPEGGINLEGYIDALNRHATEWRRWQEQLGNSF